MRTAQIITGETLRSSQRHQFEQPTQQTDFHLELDTYIWQCKSTLRFIHPSFVMNTLGPSESSHRLAKAMALCDNGIDDKHQIVRNV